ncbi:alpha/beta-hydrolase [Dendrothele bispora CBS 962.96]|uniref:Alpha/beta-hydrolase n=1 Tax=Dendrothele bispora (strain CBS 962.96) TaxID=1314807 RepID=A0A4S8MFI8_DENBC|nr:alpha/beta-hydrolase [Dendrothele bispora CBS 962.96]
MSHLPARVLDLLPWPLNCISLVKYDNPDQSKQKYLNDDDTEQGLTAVLNHYAKPGVSPPSARIDPRLKLQERRPLRLWHMWKYGFVVAAKATEVTVDIVLHNLLGPRRKSWGIEMTIINSLMRGAGRHSALVDVGTIRLLISLVGLVPLPSDALVTPVKFSVRRRNLRGILAEFDKLETGTRELSGEWVVGRKTWQRLQHEWKNSDGSHCSKKKERVVLYIHGGAYYVSSAAAQRMISIPLSKYMDARVFALDYRLAPETTFPGPLHDAVNAYMRLTEDLSIPPENIIVAGDSAGGGLSLALLMYLRDNNYALPSAAILMSPWVDLTMSCESWESNASYDVIPMLAPDDHMNPVALYLGDNMERYITHPYASPLFGDFRGLPPLLIQAGDAEVLRDEITLLAHKATLAGVQVRHELYEDAIHIFQLYPFLEAATRSLVSMRDFVRNFLPQVQSGGPRTLDVKAEKVLEHEIECESARMVRGDGVETSSGLASLRKTVSNPSLGELSSSDTDEDDTGRRLHPSWRRRNWSIAPSQDGDSSSEDEDEKIPIVATRRRSGTLPASISSSDFRKSPSTVSITDPDTPLSPPLVRPMMPQRTSSYVSVSSHKSMTFTHSIPPSPSIRRSRANSYADLSRLVKDWTDTGPANETMYLQRS